MKSRSTKYRIFLADDHAVLRYGLKNLLSKDGSFAVVAEASNGLELLELLKNHEGQLCDLILLDLSMPELDGLRTLEKLRENYPDIKVVIFSMHKEREFLRTAVALGVQGYILKDDDFERIPIALKQVLAGQKYFSPELTSFIVEDYSILRQSEMSLVLLTKREKEILIEIARGATSKEIAERLQISFRTVQTHRSNIMEKLQLRNTAALVKYALDQGLI